MNLGSFLRRFANYQTRKFDKAENQSGQDHHKHPIWAAANTAETTQEKPFGWIGGKGRSTKSYRIPERNKRVYNHICEIDCDQLSANVWGGLGPRSGSLAFFVALDGPLDLKIIPFEPPIGDEPQTSPPPRNGFFAFNYEDNKWPGFVPELPAWPLYVMKGCQSADEAYSSIGESRKNPFKNFRLHDPELAPANLRELQLLVEIGHSRLASRVATAKSRLQNMQQTIDSDASGLVDVLQKRIQLSRNLVDYLTNKYSDRPFDMDDWASEYEHLAELSALDTEWSLEHGEPCMSPWSIKEILSWYPRDYPSSPPGHIEACQELEKATIELRKEINRITESVPAMVGGLSNRAGYKKYREDHPEEWLRFADHLRTLNAEYTRICFASFECAAQGMQQMRYPYGARKVFFHVGRGQPPTSLQEAVEKLNELISRSGAELAEIADTESRDRELASLAENHRQLAGHFQKVEEVRNRLMACEQQSFMLSEWTDIPKWLDGLMESDVLSEHAFSDYVTMRGLMSQIPYQKHSRALHPAAKKQLKKVWSSDAKQAPLQIGGEPTGCEYLPSTVMLMKIPTNYLTGFMFGDVDQLIVLIERSQLAQGNFHKARAVLSY